MKKNVLVLLLAFSIILNLLALNLILAANIQLTKDSYYPSETLQAEISGNFIDTIKLENIGIYKENAAHKTPVEAGLVKSDNKYLYYALLPETAGNYSLKIEGVRYYQENNQTNQPIIKNFTIIRTDTSYLSFTPGAIAATTDFSIKIKAYNQEQTVNVEFLATGQKESFSLGDGNERTIYFSISSIKNFTKSSIKINSYTIQAMIAPPLFTQENQTINITELNLSLEDIIDVSPREINATILPDISYDFEVSVFNRLTKSIKDINISSSDEEVNISPATIEELETNYTIKITITSDEDIEDGFVRLTYQNSSIEIPVRIKIVENESEVTYTLPLSIENKTCTERGGVKCNAEKNEQCTGTLTYASDGLCCLGECQVKKASKSWIWGIVILVILAIAGYFLYKQQKKVPGGEKAEEIFKKKAEEYKERMEAGPEEVRKKLTKI